MAAGHTRVGSTLTSIALLFRSYEFEISVSLNFPAFCLQFIPCALAENTFRGLRCVIPNGARRVKVIHADFLAAIKDGVNHCQPEDMNLGPRNDFADVAGQCLSAQCTIFPMHLRPLRSSASHAVFPMPTLKRPLG